MSEIIDIDEGLTYDYVVHGLVVFLLGVGLCFFHWIPGVIILFTGILLIAAKSGLQIDVQSKKARKYINLIGIKNGAWRSLENFKSGRLEFSKEEAEFLSRTGARTHRVRSFDLILKDDLAEEVAFHQFTSYNPARKFIAVLQKQFGITIYDVMHESMKKSQNRIRR